MNKKFVFTGVILMSVLISGVLLAKKNSTPETVPVESLGPKVRGSAKAPVEIIEYSDFQCPACQRAQKTLHDIEARYPGQIRLVYRHFPLSGHQWSGLAHQAAECAARQNRFWDFQDRLFKDQLLWSTPQSPADAFVRYAQELGLDLDTFGVCLADENVKKQIQDEKQAGLASKVNSTPTFFINGERVVGHVELGIKGDAQIRKILNLEPAAVPEPAAKTA